MINQVVAKIGQIAGATLIAFVYGAGVSSVILGSSDIKKLKRRMDNLEDDTTKLAMAAGKDVMDIKDRLDRLEDRECFLCHRIDDIRSLHMSDYYDILDRFSALREELKLENEEETDEETANFDKICTILDWEEEASETKKSSKSTKK